MSCFAGILLMATSCMDNDNQNIEPVPFAYVSLYNASPDAPDLDIIIDDQKVNSYPFDYAEYTGYLRFFTGNRNLKFGLYGAQNIVADTTVEFKEQHVYSVFVVDNYEHADILVTEDTGEPGEGEAMIRFLNLSPDAPVVNLDAGGETPMFEGQAFKATSAFKAVDAGSYDFVVTGEGETLLNMPDTKLVAGRYYTVIVRGYQEPPAGNANVLGSEIITE